MGKLSNAHLWAKSKVVDKDYCRGGNSLAVIWTEEIALEKLVWRVFLAIPENEVHQKPKKHKRYYQPIQRLNRVSIVTALSEGILAFSIPTHNWHSMRAATWIKVFSYLELCR